MSSLLDNLNILVVTETKKELLSFIKVDYTLLINLINLSTLPQTEYLSFSFFNITNKSIVEQAEYYKEYNLILLIDSTSNKLQSIDICTFIKVPFINIRII